MYICTIVVPTQTSDSSKIDRHSIHTHTLLLLHTIAFDAEVEGHLGRAGQSINRIMQLSFSAVRSG